MKAKLKNGEIVDVRYYSQNPITKEIYSISYGVFGKKLEMTDEFELILETEILNNSFDWESFRNETAAKAMQGILASNAEYLFGNMPIPVPCEVARQAVMQADALISELQNTKQ